MSKKTTDLTEKLVPVLADTLTGLDSEDTNLSTKDKVFTIEAIWDAIFQGKTTTDLPEWDNLYYTTAKVTADTVWKEDITNKSTSISADSWSDTKYPSVNAVEDYVWAFSIPDATTTVKGKVRLATETEAQNASWNAVISANYLNALSHYTIATSITSQDIATFTITLSHSLWRIPRKVEYTWYWNESEYPFKSKGFFNHYWNVWYIFTDISDDGNWTDWIWYITAWGSGDFYKMSLSSLTDTEIVLSFTEVWSANAWNITQCLFTLT